ncbi:hypothetical protein SO802_013672 [Lithocarpus litseifolius]|uniref:Uncharacterized protein n=1 Tax=Lithocarpus litseifolius TaxID=425828 RepID=A0AAW2DBR4_9ROSI
MEAVLNLVERLVTPNMNHQLLQPYIPEEIKRALFKMHPSKSPGPDEDVDEEEDLVESKFEKMDEQDDFHTTYAKLYKVLEKYEKLYKLATKKLSDVELKRSVCGFAETSRGAVARVAQNSDDRPVVEVGIWSDTGGGGGGVGETKLMILSWEKNR